MYVHAHLRYGEAMAVLGEADALWDALQVANPIAVTERLAHASPRQRNAYFSSSDAAFPDRYRASAEWGRVKAGEVAVDGGWRILFQRPGPPTPACSSPTPSASGGVSARAPPPPPPPPQRVVAPVLPRSVGRVTVEMAVAGRPVRWDLPPTT